MSARELTKLMWGGEQDKEGGGDRAGVDPRCQAWVTRASGRVCTKVEIQVSVEDTWE